MDRVGRYLRALAALTCLAVACGDCDDPPGGEVSALPAATTTPGALRNLYPGHSISVDRPVVVRGKVTTSDRAGNFYRTFLVEADDGAIEVMAGTDQNHNRYPIGCQVALRLEGTVLGMSRGVLQAGRSRVEYDANSVEAFESQQALDRIVVRGELTAPTEALPIAVDALDPALCGRLVRIDGLKVFVEEEAELPPAAWSGYLPFEDGSGRIVHAYTSSYARFADEAPPSGTVSLTGILQYGTTDRGEGYIIKMRDATDCTDH